MTEAESYNVELGQAGVDLIAGTASAQTFDAPEGHIWGLAILPSRNVQTIWQCLYKGEVQCVLFATSTGDNWKFKGKIDQVRILSTSAPHAPVLCHRSLNA